MCHMLVRQRPWRGSKGVELTLECEIQLSDSKVDYLTLGDLGLERRHLGLEHVPLAPYTFSQLSYGGHVRLQQQAKSLNPGPTVGNP